MHYHWLEIQSPSTLFKQQEYEATAEKFKAQAQAKFQDDIIILLPEINSKNVQDNVIYTGIQIIFLKLTRL